MMNYQGEMNYSNCNANSQNKANHQSTGTLQLFPTVSPLTAGDQRFSAQVSGSNHVGLGIGSSAGFHSYGPGNPNNCNSHTSVIGHGRSSSAAQEQGGSSSTAAQTEFSKQQAYEVYGSNGINISTSLTSPAVHQQHSETIIGHGNIRSDVQYLNGAMLPENFGSNTHHHTAANQQALLPTSNVSSGYMRNNHIQLPALSPLYGQDNHHPLFRSAESFINPISSVQPDEHAPNYHETSPAHAWTHLMRPSSGYSSFLPLYSSVESSAMAPFYDPRNINENDTLNQIGRIDWAYDPRTPHFMRGVSNRPGIYICPFHGFDHSAFQPATDLSWFQGFNYPDPCTLTSARTTNGHVPLTTGTSWHCHNPAESAHSAALQEMGYPVRSGNAAFQNQNTSRAGSEAPSTFGLTWLLAHSQRGLGLWPQDPEARFQDLDDNGIYHYFWSSANTQNRRRLSLELHYRLELLNSAEPWRPLNVPPELRMLDNSVMADILMGWVGTTDIADSEDQAEDIAEDPAEPDGGIEDGLTEEMVDCFLNLEKFQPIPDGSEEKDCCCICQDDYQENEDLGKFWCGHRFHVECIKSWLLLKNICPMCKQIAIPSFEE